MTIFTEKLTSVLSRTAEGKNIIAEVQTLRAEKAEQEEIRREQLKALEAHRVRYFTLEDICQEVFKDRPDVVHHATDSSLGGVSRLWYLASEETFKEAVTTLGYAVLDQKHYVAAKCLVNPPIFDD
jgi:DNA-binding Xre family transcriptional regulator